MSESRAVYNVGNTDLTTKSAFRRLDCVKPYGHPKYRAPTHFEIAALMSYSGLVPEHLAQALGMVWDSKNGNATFRRWKTDGKSQLPIPYTPWRLLLIYSGIVQPEFPRHYA